ncbi:endonuclease [Skermanella stibiiresistens SB22]|uniref:Endonuclease n=2 Tax=Skermanella TaxID=204447 RepID=W9GWQ9_9PROT|nr:endonuclease [Skermanella stibiiresistens SB22]
MWRPVRVAPWYQVNIETGTVRNGVTGRHLKARPNKAGYLTVTLKLTNGTSKPELVHRLVTLAYHGNPRNQRLCASHLDGDKLNNHYSNLRWKSPLANARDKDAHGTTPTGERNGNSKLSEDAAWRAYWLSHVDGWSSRRIGSFLGISYGTVQKIARHDLWTNSNFKQRLTNAQEQENSSERITMAYLEAGESMSDGGIYRPLSDFISADIYEQEDVSKNLSQRAKTQRYYQFLTQQLWDDRQQALAELENNALVETLDKADALAWTGDTTSAPAPTSAPRKSRRF